MIAEFKTGRFLYLATTVQREKNESKKGYLADISRKIDQNSRRFWKKICMRSKRLDGADGD